MGQKQNILPHREDAERAVIGSILLQPDVMEYVYQEMQPEDFYLKGPREIYTAESELYRAAAPIDITTVINKLQDRGTLELVGGRTALVDLFNETVTAANVKEYAKIVKETSYRRQTIKATEELKQAAERETADKGIMRGIYAQLEQIRDGIEETRSQKKTTGYADIFLTEQKIRETETPAAYGITDLDKLTGGIHKGQLIVIGGRPGTGKSAIALQIADSVQAKGYKTMFCPLEMTAYETLERLAIRHDYFNQEEAKAGTIPPERKAAAAEYFNTLESNKALVIYEGLNDLNAIVHKIRLEKPHLVIIDQLTQIEPGGRYKDNRERYMQVTRKLKEVALTEQIAVILTTQLNRPAEDKKKPTLANLHESDSTGQDADVVLMLTHAEDQDAQKRFREVTLHLVKQRQGTSGNEILLMFEGAKYNFEASFRDAANWETPKQRTRF